MHPLNHAVPLRTARRDGEQLDAQLSAGSFKLTFELTAVIHLNAPERKRQRSCKLQQEHLRVAAGGTRQQTGVNNFRGRINSSEMKPGTLKRPLLHRIQDRKS